MTELETSMAGRVRRHFVTVFGTVAVAVGAPILLVGAAAALSGGRPPEWLLLLFPLAFLAVPVAGFVSTSRNLRCPGCEGSVVWLAARNQSLFADAAEKTCPHCQKQIFPSDQGLRLRPRFAVLMGLGALLALAGALVGSLGRP
jgi:hypothetical protein